MLNIILQVDTVKDPSKFQSSVRDFIFDTTTMTLEEKKAANHTYSLCVSIKLPKGYPSPKSAHSTTTSRLFYLYRSHKLTKIK